MNAKTSIPCLAALSLFTAAGRAQDAQSAAFPDKAQAILVQGSTENRFKYDINSMATVLTAGADRWQYGAANVQKLLYTGAGAGLTSWANVGTAFKNAANTMWSRPAREQNLVYVQSGHGLDAGGRADGSAASPTDSQMDFGAGAAGGSRSSVAFRNLIRDNLPQGHTRYSLNGATPTTCVRTMNYLLEPCFSGGQISELTSTLGSKEYRRKYFPALSDITVMTAADSNENSYGLANGNGNRFMRELYGYDSGGHVSGTLEGAAARNSWSVYQTAAKRNIANGGAAYTPNSAMGAGNNAMMFVRSAASDGRDPPEHNLYRHVQFYPSLTFGEGVDGRVNVGAGNANLDFRLNAANAPIAGTIPITLALAGSSGGAIGVDRDRLPYFNVALPDPSLSFVQFYAFNLFNTSGLTFTSGSMSLAMEPDDAAAASLIGLPRLFRFNGSQWLNSGPAAWDPGTTSFSLGNVSALGTYAVVVPTPATVALLALSTLFAAPRRSRPHPRETSKSRPSEANK